jgi:hypothetical protein
MQYLQGEQGEDPMVNSPEIGDILPTSTGPAPDVIADLNLGDTEGDVEF